MLNKRGWLWLSWATLFILFLIGTIRAFHHGANDFSVFYEAWRLVLAGRGAEIYSNSPDRFLYSPGFAWMLSPLALLPKSIALLAWSLFKLFLVICIIKRLGGNKVAAIWGTLLVSRPILIDLQYGQVNLIILAVCTLALLGHFNSKVEPIFDRLLWGFLGIISVAKIFPLPLLIVPWIIKSEIPLKKLKLEKEGIILGIVSSFVVPVFTQGLQGGLNLLFLWKDALVARGLPLESHNQSFTALIFHYLSGLPTQVMSEGSVPLSLGFSVLSHHQIVLLSVAWSLLTTGFLLGWILSGNQRNHLQWIAVTIGLLIVPSHLVWKPYFVMSLPLAILAVENSLKKKQGYAWFLLGLLFAGINLSGFDFIGHHWAAHLEAASIFLLMHFILLFWAITEQRAETS